MSRLQTIFLFFAFHFSSIVLGEQAGIRVVDPITYGAKADGKTDDTRSIQKAITSLKPGNILDGKNRTYIVSTIWLKSNMTITNFRILAKAANIDDLSPISIGNDLQINELQTSPDGLRAFRTSSTWPGHINIILRNIHVNGNRKKQTNIHIRDGGRHGFSIKGFASNILIEDCSAMYCATDGISIYRGLHTQLETSDVQALQHITIRRFKSLYNGRHGGSGDSIDDFRCENSQFSYNGLDINGGKLDGEKGSLYLSKKYGTGWDMEGYGMGSRVSNIIFQKCSFTKNASMGLNFYDIASPQTKGFKQRTSVFLNQCILDTGSENPVGDYCLSFSSTIENKSMHNKLYNTIQLSDCVLTGMTLFRSCENVFIQNCSQKVKAGCPKGILDYVQNLSTLNLKTNAREWEHYRSAFKTH